MHGIFLHLNIRNFEILFHCNIFPNINLNYMMNIILRYRIDDFSLITLYQGN